MKGDKVEDVGQCEEDPTVDGSSIRCKSTCIRASAKKYQQAAVSGFGPFKIFDVPSSIS